MWNKIFAPVVSFLIKYVTVKKFFEYMCTELFFDSIFPKRLSLLSKLPFCQNEALNTKFYSTYQFIQSIHQSLTYYILLSRITLVDCLFLSS